MSESNVTETTNLQGVLPLPRFHFGDAYEAAVHAAAINNRNNRERQNQEQRIDRAQIEAEEAEENERSTRALEAFLSVQRTPGGVL
jgi:hypothetical protein